MDLLDDTAVFVVGDHGENIGDHGLMDHQYSLHDTLLHVPLIVRYPDVFEPETRSSLVELRDLYPTIAGLVGASVSGTGVSTVNLADPGGRDEAFAEYRFPQPSMTSLRDSVTTLQEGYERLDRTLRSVRTDDWRLIEADDGSVSLYRAGDETTDLADDRIEVVEDLRGRLNDHGIELGRGAERATEVSDAHEERLEALGYI
jgi:arylsulfatase A-like enzyme